MNDLKPVLRQTWLTILDDIYRECRRLGFWCDVYELHDAEDQAYFMRLDDLKEAL